MNKIDTALKILAEVNEEIAAKFPVGTTFKARKGRGFASYKVVGYPEEPCSVSEAMSVIAEGKSRTFEIDIRIATEVVKP